MGKPQVLSDGTPLSRANQLVYGTGRWAEFRDRRRELIAGGLSKLEATERLLPEFIGEPAPGAESGGGECESSPEPAEEEGSVSVEPFEFESEDGSYLETMEWVCGALGRADGGERVVAMDAPGPKAWALFQWASTDSRTRKEFFGLWSQANRRQAEEEGASLAESRKQEAELESMLDEIAAETSEMMREIRGEDS